MTTAQTLASLGSLFSTQPLSYRNKIINGNFEYWQRGASLSAGTGGRFLADRWQNYSVGSTHAASLQAFTLGQTDVPGEPAAFHRVVVSSVAGAGNYALLLQSIESVRTLAGQSAVLSFYAKADTTRNIAVEFNQSFGTGGSPSAPVNGIGVAGKTLTTAWQKFTVPVTLPSIAGKTLGANGDDNLAVFFWFEAGSTFAARSANIGQQSGTFDIARVQLEAGTVATPFEQRPAGLEVSLCQRYFEAIGVNGINVYNQSAGGALMDIVFNTPKRAFPTLVYNGAMPTGENTNTPTSVAIDRNNTGRVQLVWTGTGGPGSATAGRMVGGGTMFFSAEL